MTQSAPIVTSPKMTVFSRHINVVGEHFSEAKFCGCCDDMVDVISMINIDVSRNKLLQSCEFYKNKFECLFTSSRISTHIRLSSHTWLSTRLELNVIAYTRVHVYIVIQISSIQTIMAPRKRGPSIDSGQSDKSVKRISKTEVEKLICKKKLDKLEEEESQIREDRFNNSERRSLLDAYNIHGFQVFQDTKLLHHYLPNRRECDLKGLVLRLRSSLNPHNSNIEGQSDHVDDWQKLCQQFMGNFAKDRKVNLDDVLSDALAALAEEESIDSKISEPSSDIRPNYSILLKSFAHLLMGKFPDNLSPIDAQLSMNLFDHVNKVVDSFDLKSALVSLEDGTWLETSMAQRRQRQETALLGLDEIDGKTKKSPTLRDLEKNRYIEALCLELPKIKRITDVLNPLFINESLLSTLMD